MTKAEDSAQQGDGMEEILGPLVRAAIAECWPQVQSTEMIGSTFGLGGGSGTGPSNQTSWHFRNEKDLLELPSVRALLDYIWEQDWDYKLRDELTMKGMRKHDKSEWDRDAFSATITRAFANVSSKNDIRYPRESVDAMAEELIAHLLSEDPLFIEMVPLANFEYKGPEMEWGDSTPVNLRRVTDHERAILQEAGVYGRTAYHAREDPEWCLATRLSRQEASRSGWMSGRLASFLGALQMTKDRHFVPVTVLYYPTRWLESISCQWMANMTSWGGMSVEPSDLHGLDQRASNILAALRLKGDAYRVFLRRYMLAHERRRPDDQIIDLVTAMEAIMLEHEQELSLRFSLRVAVVAAESVDSRMESFHIAKNAYSLRSKAVHGRAAAVGYAEVLRVDRLARACGEAFAEAAAENPKLSPATWHKTLDERMITGRAIKEE